MNRTPPRPKYIKLVGIISVIVILIILALLFRAAGRFLEGFSIVGDQDPSIVAYFETMDEMRDALKREPDDQEARMRLAEASFHLGGVREAIQEIKIIEQSGSIPKGLDALNKEIDDYRRAWNEAGSLYAESLNHGEPASFYPGIHAVCDEVIARYDAVLRQRAWFLKAHILLREGRKDEARREIEHILGKYILLNDYCQYYFARSLATNENSKLALREFDKLIQFHPESRIAPLGYLEQANILRDEGGLDDAAGKAQALIDRYPDSGFVPIAHRKLAEIYDASGKTHAAARERYKIIDGWPGGEEARRAIAVLKESDPDFDSFTAAERLRLLEVLVDRGMYDHAEPMLIRLRDSSTGDTELAAGCIYNLARIYFHRGLYEECINKCRELRDIDRSGPWSGKALNRIGHSYRRLGNLDKAADAYDIVARDYPDLAPYALYNAGDIYLGKGDINSAVNRFSKLASEYPDSSETEAALKQLFMIAYRRGDYTGCIGHADRLIELFPDGVLVGAAHFWRAKALSKLGREIDATEELIYVTGRFQRNFYGIRAMEILGASEREILNLITTSGAQFGGGITGPGPAWLDIGRELLRANIFDLALEEFASLPEGITPEASFAEVQMAYLAGDWYTSYKTARDIFARGHGNLLNAEELSEMLMMGFPLGCQEEVKAAAARYGLDPSWLNGVILQESTFQSTIVSHANAIGLMQILPSTGTFIAHLKGLSSFDSSTLYDINTNLDYGACYLDYLRDSFDSDLVMTLAAYNGGPGNARTWRRLYYRGDMDLFIESIPASETRDFVKYVYTNIRVCQAIAAKGNSAT